MYERVNTKENIEDIALRLFSKQGYLQDIQLACEEVRANIKDLYEKMRRVL